MKKQLFIVASVLMFLFVIGASFAGGGSESNTNKNASKAIRVATDATWPPMEFIETDSGKIVGFDVDLLTAIGKEVGLSFDFKAVAWDGIFAGLDIGDYDMVSSSVTITDERKKTMTFSKPYFNAGQILAVSAKNASKYKGLKDMVGRQVGAQIGTSGASEVAKYNGVILKTYDSLGPAVEELANGTIDGIVADTPLIADYLLKNKKYAGKFVTVGEVMTSEEYGFVFSKKDPLGLEAKINAGLDKVKSNGVYDQLVSKWIK